MSEGELFRVETVDWTGGQIGDNDSAEDIKHVDLSQVTLQLAQTSPVVAAKGPWLPTWKGLAACFHGCQTAYSGPACALDDTCPAACHRLLAACIVWHVHSQVQLLAGSTCVCCRCTTCQDPSVWWTLMASRHNQVRLV